MTLTIERDGKEKSIDVKLKEQKSQTTQSSDDTEYSVSSEDWVVCDFCSLSLTSIDFSLPSLSIVNVTESPGFLFWYK